MEKEAKRELRDSYKNRTIVGAVFGIRCTRSGKVFVFSDTDLTGTENRFCFSVLTDSCPYHQLSREWAAYGKDAFVLELLERVEKPDEQSQKDFAEELMTLAGLYKEKYDRESLL